MYQKNNVIQEFNVKTQRFEKLEIENDKILQILSHLYKSRIIDWKGHFIPQKKR